jgi:hypothetical protein
MRAFLHLFGFWELIAVAAYEINFREVGKIGEKSTEVAIQIATNKTINAAKAASPKP